MSGLMVWYCVSFKTYRIYGPSLKLCFKGSFAAPTRLPSSTNFLKPYQPSPFDRLFGRKSKEYYKNSHSCLTAGFSRFIGGLWKVSLHGENEWNSCSAASFSRLGCGLLKSRTIEFFAEKRIAEIDAKIDANISADGKVDIYSPYIRHMLGWMQISI